MSTWTGTSRLSKTEHINSHGRSISRISLTSDEASLGVLTDLKIMYVLGLYTFELTKLQPQKAKMDHAV